MRPSQKRRQRHLLLQLIPVLACVLVGLIIIACILPGEASPGTSMESTSGQSTNSSGSSASGSSSQSTQTTQTTQTTQSSGSTSGPPPSSSSQTQPPEPVDLEAFFNETVFIGDSITYGLSTYCNIYRLLYGAKFLCAGSYAVRHAITEPDPDDTNIVSVRYQGVPVRPEDALAQMGAKQVFIMLGLNDLSFGVDYTINNWRTLIANIREACPDIEIYIQSGTPLHAKKDMPNYKLNNANMDLYNQALQQLCEELGCHYVDVATALKDENGQLRNEYCSDEYCHMTYAGIEVWIQTLKDYVSNLNNV